MEDRLEQSIQLLCQRVKRLLEKNVSSPQERLLIAIAGVPGSGKSTVSAALLRRLHSSGINNVAVVPMDGFHYPKKALYAFPDPELAIRRRGAPFTFNADALLDMIVRLKRSPVTLEDEVMFATRAPSFDHAIQDPLDNDIYISSSDKVVMLEGNYLLLDEHPWRKIATLADETWFVDITPEIARQRLIVRHLSAGIEKTIADAAARAEDNDIPNGDLIRAKLIQPNVTILN